MKKIILILTFIFIGNSVNAQEISCKKIFPMPNGMEVGKVFELPNNQYLINNKKYDQNFNLLHEYTDLFDSTNNFGVEVFQNKIFSTSKSNGNLAIKLFDSNTDTMINSYVISPLHSSNQSLMLFATTGIDDNGNFYIFTTEENYFSGGIYHYYHKLYKFDSQLTLLWSKDYNTSSSGIYILPFKIICFNNIVILVGLKKATSYSLNFDVYNFGPTSYDEYLLFEINPSNGNINNPNLQSCFNNGQLQNFTSVKVFKNQDDIFLIASEKSSTNEQFISFYKFINTSSSISLSSSARVKSSSSYIAPMGYAIKDNQLIVAAHADPGNLTWWNSSTISNSPTDVIWLVSSISDFSNREIYLSTWSVGHSPVNNFQTIDNKMGILFSKAADGNTNIDEQSLYMQNDDIGFAVFSSDTGFKEIAFYQQGVTPNPNNPNNYLNQDKPIRFKVKVKNELSQNLSALSGTITCSTPGVTISDNTVNFPPIQSGDITWSIDTFEITVDPSVANGTNLEFELSCNDTLVSSGTWISYFSFPIAPLQTGTVVLLDNQGDNDGIPEPGENNIILQPKINNVSNLALASIRGILSSDDSFLNITQNDYMYNVQNNVPEPIEIGDMDIVPAFPYKFDYPANQALQELNFNLEIQAHLQDNNGTLLKWQDTFSFNDGVEPPPVIVSTTPTNNATDVAIDTDLTINFNKNISAVSGKNIYIYKNSNLDLTIPVTSSEVSIINDEVTINLSNDLDSGSDYFVIIDAGAFQDSQGQDFSGITQSSEWNFSTIQSNPPIAPQLTATVISDTEISLIWNSVADADTYKVSSCDGTTVYANSLTTTDFTVDNLTTQTTYDFIVQAENSAGLSPSSNCEQVTTLCGLPWGNPVIYPNFTRAFCVVTIDGQPATEQDKVAAFVGTELRGIGDVFLSNGTAYSVVNIQGSVVETASFKVWDATECSSLNVNYVTDTNPTGTIGASPNYLPISAVSSSSIINKNLKNSIKLYPNPTNNIIYIDNKVNLNIQKITLYDVLGKQVLQIKENTNQISINRLNKGVYFIKIETNKGNFISKVVKKL